MSYVCSDCKKNGDKFACGAWSGKENPTKDLLEEHYIESRTCPEAKTCQYRLKKTPSAELKI